MKCSTCKCPYICEIIRIFRPAGAFLVVRLHIQTHEQNIQLGSQTEAGKMLVLCTCRHETC